MATEMVEASELRSRIAEIRKICIDDESNPLDDHNLLKDCALHLESRVQQIVSEFSDFDSLGVQDLDAYLEHLKDEFNKVEVETTHVASEIELLATTHKDDSILLQAKLEERECLLDHASTDQKKEEATEGIASRMLADGCSNLTIVNIDKNLEHFVLDNKIDEMNLNIKSLEDVHCKVKWFDAVEQIEDALTGLKVLAVDENCIKLSLRTYMPAVGGISYIERVEDIIDVCELNHQLLIEVYEGKLKNVQVIPNDICVNDIVVAAESVSKFSLQWLIQKVQDRIILNTLRCLVVKDANKSRYSLEYFDKDETIVAHMFRGIDAYIKLSHGWPIFGSPLKLISIQGSDILKRFPVSFHCKVKNLADSLDIHIRQNVSSFVDAVEKVLIEQLQLDPQAGASSDF